MTKTSNESDFTNYPFLFILGERRKRERHVHRRHNRSPAKDPGFHWHHGYETSQTGERNVTLVEMFDRESWVNERGNYRATHDSAFSLSSVASILQQ